jgi:pimeloyl-ACP methyl ester carboxylesterase
MAIARAKDAAMSDPNPGLDVYARPQLRVRINRRRRVNLHCTGKGEPTVILAHGLGGSTLEWCLVQPRVAEFAKVIAYDRPGFGFSDPGPLPRTTDRILADLRAALRAVGATPPYVLASHSAGNFEMRLFAFLHPEEVAGMVLIDPSGDDQANRSRALVPLVTKHNDAARARLKMFEAWARAGRLVPANPEYDQCVGPTNPRLPDAVNDSVRGWRLKPASWRALYAEDCALSHGANDHILASARRDLGPLPLIVLTAGRIAWSPEFTSAEIEAMTRLWTRFHDEHARLSTRGVRRDAPDCGHAIHIERPEVVVEAIREVIASAGA